MRPEKKVIDTGLVLEEGSDVGETLKYEVDGD